MRALRITAAAFSLALTLVFTSGCDELLNSCLAVFTIEEFNVSPNPATAGQSVLVTWELLNEESTFPHCNVAVITPGGTELIAIDRTGSGSVSFTATEDATVAIDCSQLCGGDEMKVRELMVTE